MVGYYDGFDMGEKRNRKDDAIQRRAYENSMQLILMPRRTADSTRKDYGVPDGKINVPHFGAKQDVPDCLPECRRSEKLRLLFVGKEWVRKGGSVAIEALRSLRDRGIDSELVMAGCDRPKDATNAEGLMIIPYVKDVSPFLQRRGYSHPAYPSGMRRHRVLRSSRSRPAFGHDRHWGVPDYVEDGVTGRLLPVNATRKDFADVIAELWSDDKAMEEMRLAASQGYEEDLNWDV